MLAILARQLKKFTITIENITLKETHSRLAAYLLHLSKTKENTDTIELNMPKTIIANLLGTSRENLSRILNKMVKEKLIEIKNKNIKLLDIQKIKSYL